MDIPTHSRRLIDNHIHQHQSLHMYSDTTIGILLHSKYLNHSLVPLSRILYMDNQSKKISIKRLEAGSTKPFFWSQQGCTVLTIDIFTTVI